MFFYLSNLLIRMYVRMYIGEYTFCIQDRYMGELKIKYLLVLVI